MNRWGFGSGLIAASGVAISGRFFGLGAEDGKSTVPHSVDRPIEAQPSSRKSNETVADARENRPSRNGKSLTGCERADPQDALAPKHDIAQFDAVFFQVVSNACVVENMSEVPAVGANFFETEGDLIGYNRCRSRSRFPRAADGGGTGATTEVASL